jgi:hypothetical protein
MWILNKKTGNKWDVSDEELIARLLADEDYKELEKDNLIEIAEEMGIKADKRMKMETILKKIGGE